MFVKEIFSSRPQRARHALRCGISYMYRIGKKKYVWSDADTQMAELLAEIHRAADYAKSVTWLLPYRRRLRALLGTPCRPMLTVVIRQTRVPTLVNYAIWLRGLGRGSLGTTSIETKYRDLDLSGRKVAARALRRMGAWAELKRIAENEMSERVRRIATSHPGRSFADRMGTFSGRSVEPCEVDPQPQSVNLPDRIELRAGKPAKSEGLIRSILERIRRLIQTD